MLAVRLVKTARACVIDTMWDAVTESASAVAAGAQPWMDSAIRPASAAMIAVPARVQRLRCVTLRQDTGLRSAVLRSCEMLLCPQPSVRLADMAGTDPAEEIAALTSTLDSIEAVLDPGELEKEAASLREQAADPGLWADQDRAQKVTRRLSYLEAELGRLTGLRQRLGDTSVLFDLAESEDDEPTREEAVRELGALRSEIDQLEVRTLLNGDYDAREALISINAQAGGADPADFEENLLRMYLRWAERHKYPTE